MVFTDLPLTQEFKTLGMDDYLWVQALFNHEELERLRGVEPTILTNDSCGESLGWGCQGHSTLSSQRV